MHSLLKFHHHLYFNPLGEKSLYIFTEIYRRIAVYSVLSRCLFVQSEEGYRKKTYCRDQIIHISYGTCIKTRYMYMRFLKCVKDTVCPQLFQFETYLFSSVLCLSQRAKGPRLWICRPGINCLWIVSFLLLLLDSSTLAPGFSSLHIPTLMTVCVSASV